MELSEGSSKELQRKVGVTEELTNDVLNAIKGHKPTLGLLPVLNLLLLERYELAVPLVRAVIDEFYDLEYITSLQKSRFFLQRMSVPQLSSGIPPGDRRVVLGTSLSDGAVPVIREAVRSIVEDSPFSDFELHSIAEQLSGSTYASARTLSADILTACSKIETPLLERLLGASTWRLRLRFAILFDKFSKNDQLVIIRWLVADSMDEVRLHLSKHINTLDHSYLLKDSSEFVRTIYLSNVIDKIEDEKILISLASDSSWDVKKQVLKLGPVMFSRLATPLIGAISIRANWRVSYEILSILYERCGEEMVVKQVMEYLFSKMFDKVSVVRCKAGEVLTRVFTMYKWTDQYIEQVKNVAESSNYLHRLVGVPLAITCDKAHGTAISKVLMNDSTPNVRQCYEDFCATGKADICMELDE
ncbi:hypothetical protein PAEPH01_0415 [Pancytospora epiphaga]|nr:hypothetical protein PAEPH01_0415 [Pancytospora epiphaga]